METRRTFIKKGALIGAMVALPTLPSCYSTIKATVPMKTKSIKKATVLWYSQTGNTQRCGSKLVKALEKDGVKVSYGEVREFEVSQIEDTDLLVIGAPVFYYDVPGYVKKFIKSLPNLKGIPVAAYVTFGGPEGNQYNAACSVLEELALKEGVPVGLDSFQSISSFSLTYKKEKDLRTRDYTILPDRKTYEKVRDFGKTLKTNVSQGKSLNYKKSMTLREFSTFFGPMWWTKKFVDKHSIIKEKCVGCGKCAEKCPTKSIDPDNFKVNTDTCVFCMGCINNCDHQAIYMEYGDKRVVGFNDYLKRNNLQFKL
jgi:ferredoxin